MTIINTFIVKNRVTLIRNGDLTRAVSVTIKSTLELEKIRSMVMKVMYDGAFGLPVNLVGSIEYALRELK